MSKDTRKFVGFRCSPQGVAYITYVATRDQITFSEALRRLLAAGAKQDSEATHGPANFAAGSVERSVDPRHIRADAGTGGDQNGDRRGGTVPDVPHPASSNGTGSRPDPEPVNSASTV